MPPTRTANERLRPGRRSTSCAECRRLKMKCNSNVKVPCDKCIKRGCAEICPTGTLSPGRNGFIVSGTEELHSEIHQLKSYIKELHSEFHQLKSYTKDLKDAVRSMQPNHQVLEDAPIAGPSGQHNDSRSESMAPPSQPWESSVEEEILPEAFGTLAIGACGETSFLGRTARVEHFMQAALHPPPAPRTAFPHLPSNILDAASFGVNHVADEALVKQLCSRLPSSSDAIHLCNVYLEEGKHGYHPISRAQLLDEVLPRAHRAESPDDLRFYRALALLFIIFAIAHLVDPSHPPYVAEAQEYYHYSRVSLALSSPIRATTLEAIQTLIHITDYLLLCNAETAEPTQVWLSVGMALRLGSSIGLHLNSAYWRVDALTAARRHTVFWDLFTLDTWTSLTLGRPPSMAPAYIDCPIPKTSEGADSDGVKISEFRVWIWQYSKLMHNIMSAVFGVKIPPYAKVLDLDRRIRDFPLSADVLRTLDTHEDALEAEASPKMHMQRWWIIALKETMLLHLHRPFLSEVLQDKPYDLMKHKYAPSVAASYRSAYRLIQGLRSIAWRRVSTVVSRMPAVWSHGMCAAVVMCLLVTRAPSSSLARLSLEQLDVLAELFVEAGPRCPAVASNLEYVKKLQSKAHEAIRWGRMGSPSSTSLTDAELDRLSGRTCLNSVSGLTFPEPLSSSHSATGSGPVSVSSSTPETSQSLDSIAFDALHPRVAKDMKIFDGRAVEESQSQHQQQQPVHDMWDFSPSPERDDNAMPDVRFGEPNLFSVEVYSGLHVGGYALGCPNVSVSSIGLDPSWLFFLEHLGFHSVML